MSQSVLLADVIARVTELQPHEAVAIVQQLIATDPRNNIVAPPFGPPTPYNVYLHADGLVECRGCAATLAVSEAGALLETLLLHRGAMRVPGGLRYAIARALLEVDAPPFDSIGALAQALARFEQGDRRAVVAQLVDRSIAPPVAVAAEAPPAAAEIIDFRALDRRRNMPTPTDLRRSLRAVDLQLYERRREIAPPPANPDRGSRRTAARWTGIAAVMAALAAGSTLALRHNDVGARPEARPESSNQLLESSPVPTDGRLPAGAASTQSTRRSASEDRRQAIASASLVRAVNRSDGPTFSPSFASNGTALFFHTGRNGDDRSALRAESALGNDLNVMTIVDDGSRNYHVQPSPDGSRIAFDSDRDGERGVYVANRDGSGVRRVSGPGYAAVPTWSPDGGRLAFVRAESDRPRVWNLWVLSLASGDTRRLTNYRYGQTWGASWFRDGRRVCFTHEDRVFVLDLDSGATQSYGAPIAGRLLRTAAVSPDGRHVIFQVARSGAWLLDLTDGSMRCVLTDPTAEEFAWSPDGRRVAFHSRRDGEWGIWIMAPSSAS